MFDHIILRPAPSVIWNLFLAFIPVALALAVARGVRLDVRRSNRVRWWLWTPVLLVWLVFLPNTCYLLTEWRHYIATIMVSRVAYFASDKRTALMELLILTGFYMFYSGAGLLAFFLSIWPLERLGRARLGAVLAWAKVVGFLLCSLGVYLGLIYRFNTWDLVNRDGLSRIFHAIAASFQAPFTASLIVGFATMLWVLYLGFDIWMDGFAWRMRRRAPAEDQDDAET